MMSAQLPFVSVVIPTHNRASQLRLTVETLAGQNYPENLLEIIVVNNASTDGTAAEIARISSEWRVVRRIDEPRKGAHFARNTGAVAARGEILYFTDDDMLAHPDMLRELVSVFENAEVASATGKVLPRWETEPPRWVIEHCRNALLSLLDLGDGVIISDSDPGVFSCHQAVRRAMFYRAGGFNPDTNAERFVGDNETGLNLKLARLGGRFAYVGSAVTHHMIPPARMSQRYLNSRFSDQGFCDSYTQFRGIRPTQLRLARRIAAYAPLAVYSAARAAAKRMRGDTSWRLDAAKIFYYRNRARYDARLLASERWRAFALRDDWISAP